MKRITVCTLLCVCMLVFSTDTKQVTARNNYNKSLTGVESIDRLYQRFENLDLLPQGFTVDRLLDDIAYGECLCLVAKVADWGERLWIERTNSSIKKAFLQARRYFGHLNADIEFLLDISPRENSRLLMIARRWVKDIHVEILDETISGWQMMELEYQALSKMLLMADIPRTLNEEIGVLLVELEGIQTGLDNLYTQDKVTGMIATLQMTELEYQALSKVLLLMVGTPHAFNDEEVNVLSVELEGAHTRLDKLYAQENVSGMSSLDFYSGNIYVRAYYLSALQHKLLPANMVELSFTEREPPDIMLNNKLTMLDALKIAEKMISYIDSFTGEITGYNDRVISLKVVVYSRSSAVCSLADVN